MAVKQLWDAIKATMNSEIKIDCGEFAFEFCKLNSSGQAPDLTSAILVNISDLFSNDANIYYSNNNELSFSRFLHADFVRHPFILISKERKSSVAEDNQKQSTPSSIKSNGISPPKTRIDSQKSNVSDVWGSPLRCNIPNEEESFGLVSLDSSQTSLVTKKRRPKRLGIPLSWARKIVSAFNVNSKNTPDLPSVLVLCDGGDLCTTALFGVKLFQVPLATRIAKGFKIVTVTVDEKGSIDDWNTQVKLDGGLSPACQAVYQVNTGPADREDPWGTVTVEIKWKGASRLLEIPLSEASTTIKASVRSGSMQSSMNMYHQELQFLHRIIASLTTGQVEWVSLDSESDSDKPATSLTASVKTLIETLQEEGTLGSATAQDGREAESGTFATALKNFSIAERKDYDFTDRLWKVMMNCMSTADLVSSLRLVFSALGRGQLRPFVERHNQTTVAQMVREAFTGRFSAPSLTGVQPFLFLAEVGAEKLRRDYIHLFVSQSLAAPSALEGLTATERELQARLGDLDKLHSVLEMVTLLGASLRLPTDTLGGVALQMLSHYRRHPIDPQHVFGFSVKTSEVRCVLSAMRPVMWCAEVTGQVTGAENVYESSLHCLCATQPFLHLQARRSKGAAGGGKGDNCESVENGVELSPVGDAKGQYCLVQRKESVVIM